MPVWGLDSLTVNTIEDVVGSSFNDSITGNGLDNDLIGGAGNDTLLGGLGDDLLEGGAGNDSLSGQDGDDQFDAGTGVDVIDGGAGANDVITVLGNFSAYGRSRPNATDTVLTNGVTGENITFRNIEWVQFADGARDMDEVHANLATAFDDSIEGTAGADNLSGLTGNDTLVGLAGSDTLDGGTGIDSLVGGTDNDTYVVDVAADVITEVGGEGATDQVNVAFTAAGTYVLGANVENASITNATAGVNVTGNGEANLITGNAAGNILTGLIGNDTLDGGAGSDTLIGGADDDTYVVDVATDVINETLAGSGTDQVNVAFMAAGTYVLSANVENATISNATVGVNITGNTGNNMLTGNAQNNVLTGDVGNDQLLGNAGNDTLLGGVGSDYLEGGAGNDSIDGGVIADRIYYTDGNTVSYQNATGAVNVNLSGITGTGTTGTGSATGADGTDILQNVFAVRGSAHNDIITGSSALTYEMFEGGLGDDTIDGGAITDTLSGENGNRVSYQNASGSVQVVLAAGADEGWSTGSDGVDSLYNINAVRGSNYGDSLVGSNRTDLAEHFEGRAGDDTIDGMGGNDIVRYDNASAAVYVNLNTGSATGGDGNDTLLNIEGVRGSVYNDTLIGSAGSDYLQGMAGNDTLNGGLGFDRADYDKATAGVNVTLGGLSNGTATIVASATGNTSVGIDTLTSIEGVRGSSFADSLTGSSDAVDEFFEGREGNDTINGMGGLDQVIYLASRAGVTVNLALGTATGDASVGSDTLSNIENVMGSTFNDSILGNASGNALYAQEGNDTVDGGAGNDWITGAEGNDSLSGSDGVDYLNGGLGNDTLLGGAGTDTLNAGVGVEIVDGGTESDTLEVMGDFAHYTRSRPNGTDTVLVNINGTGENITLRNIENVQFADGLKTIGQVWEDVASLNPDSITGTAGADNLSGLTGNDTLVGLAGSDTLDGGTGTDSLVGGADNDTYVVDIAADVITEIAAEGTDQVNVAFTAAGTYVLGANVENASITNATAGVNVTGNNEANLITGNAAGNILTGLIGNDTLDGGLGSDTLIGGADDDTYVVNAATDVINETVVGSSGIDQVNVAFTAAGTYVLSANVDNATISNATVGVNVTGNTGNNMLTGNAQNNVLTGLDGADTLLGGAGNDTLLGGVGKDYLEGGTGNDSIDGGVITDRLGYSDANTVSYANATAAVNVNLAGITGTGTTGTGSATGADGTDTLQNVFAVRGSAHADTITGSSAMTFEQFEGGLGNDTINGGTITDVHFGENGNRVSYQFASGAVTVDLAAGTATGADGDDQLININAVRGSAFDDILTGGTLPAGDANLANIGEHFEGGAGNDTINGMGGNDIVRYENATDAVTVDLAAGTATGDASVGTDTLSNIEGVRGSAHNDTLLGSGAGFEFFQGMGGNDSIDGGAGTDRADYDRSTAAVTVTLGGLGAGTATGTATGTDTLLNIEGVRGSNFNDSLTGSNEGSIYEFFEGRAGNDTINGMGGTDQVTYQTSTAAVTVNLATGTASGTATGTDTLQNIEDVRGSTFNDSITGSAGNNKLDGNAGNDTLLGGAGNDTLLGGAGNDSLVGDIGSDRLDAGTGTDVVDGGNDTIGGVDTLVVLGNFADYLRTRPNGTDTVLVNAGTGENITFRNIESVQFLDGLKTLAEVQTNIASLNNDSIVGTAGDDTLDGLAGNDTLEGLTGNDTYVVNVAGDAITEIAAEGTDQVNVAFTAAGTYILGANVENASITTATLGVNVTGNDEANLITGNAAGNILTGLIGNDTLDGGLGSDTLIGGADDDTYVVDVATDVINETVAGSSGIDQVNVAFTAAGTYVLSANVDNADIITATAGVNITGNALANGLGGNAQANTLRGLDGDDNLEGYAGNDSLDGGVGNDLMYGDEGNDTLNGGLGQRHP
ncbi:MAG: calcium-binding protein [Betaproteobacteria bacterium]|nr:calcium-binding protein [Betaproteobacteria bacterium]